MELKMNSRMATKGLALGLEAGKSHVMYISEPVMGSMCTEENR